MFAVLVQNRWSLFNDTAVCLLIVFSLMAFFISPLCPMGSKGKEIKQIVCAFYLPSMLMWAIVYLTTQSELLNRYGPGQFTWLMNAAIFNAFGLAFAVRLARTSKGWLRFEGIAFAIIFGLLLISAQQFRPALAS